MKPRRHPDEWMHCGKFHSPGNLSISRLNSRNSRTQISRFLLFTPVTQSHQNLEHFGFKSFLISSWFLVKRRRLLSEQLSACEVSLCNFALLKFHLNTPWQREFGLGTPGLEWLTFGSIIFTIAPADVTFGDDWISRKSHSQNPRPFPAAILSPISGQVNVPFPPHLSPTIRIPLPTTEARFEKGLSLLKVPFLLLRLEKSGGLSLPTYDFGNV